MAHVDRAPALHELLRRLRKLDAYALFIDPVSLEDVRGRAGGGRGAVG